MKNASKSLFLGLLLTSATTVVLADNFPAQTKTFTPYPTCEAGGNPSCWLWDLASYDKNNNPYLGGAYFHCDPPPANHDFTMSDVNTLITGFTVDGPNKGSLNGPGSDLAKYAFAAYLDPNSGLNFGLVRARDKVTGTLLNCYEGYRDRNGNVMQIHPGLPGDQVRKYSQN